MEFQNMMAFIHENYARKLTLEDIAQAGLIGKIDILAGTAYNIKPKIMSDRNGLSA